MDFKLRQLRKSKNLTQKDLAKILNLTQSTIASYENGKKIPTIENLLAIAKFFNVTTDFLLGIADSKENENTNIVNEASSYLSNNLTKEQGKVIYYFGRLEDENKEYIIGKMIELYKEQTNLKRIKQYHALEQKETQMMNDHIKREIGTSRDDLLVKKDIK